MRPFSSADSFSCFRNRVSNICQEIAGKENEDILKISQTELENYYIQLITVKPLILLVEEYFIENHKSVSIGISDYNNRFRIPGQSGKIQGTQIDIAVPYEGDRNLWVIRPSTFSMGGYPEIEVKDDRIIFSVNFADASADAEKLKNQIDRNIKSLADAVKYLYIDVENHNKTAPQTIKTAIKRKYDTAMSTIGVISELGIPVNRRDKPLTYTAPITKRESPIRKPKPSSEPYKAEPVLDEMEYQHILEVMRSMSLVVERNPRTFKDLDEESIRTHFLIQLNGHYEGGATGETFNGEGKTDILIRVENKNIFIGECKIWRGAKSFNDAINQLLSYLSWRDAKCALLVFNKNKNSSDIRDKMHDVMLCHSGYRRTIFHNSNGDSRYIFIKDSEPGKDIIITTQIYDIPQNF